MGNPDVVRNVVGIIGNIIGFCMFLSPLPTFLTIIQRRDVEEFVPDPYLATFLNCALWLFYGLPVVDPDSLLVATINGTGLAIEIVYLSIFFAFSPKPKRAKMLVVLYVELAFIAAVVVGVLLGAHTHERRALVVGVLCVVFCTLMYAAPLTVMKKVIVTRSVEYMPFALSFVSFLNGVCWTTYALIRFDIFIMIPNGIGTLLALAQLILYFWYYESTPKSSGTTTGMHGELPVKAGDGDNNNRSAGGSPAGRQLDP